MISVGKLKEICEYIEKEYGSDTNVVIQVHSSTDPEKFMGSYLLDYGWKDDGTLLLTNQASENAR